MAIRELRKDIGRVITPTITGEVNLNSGETVQHRVEALGARIWKELLSPKTSANVNANSRSILNSQVYDVQKVPHEFENVSEAIDFVLEGEEGKELVQGGLEILARSTYWAIVSAPADESADLMQMVGSGQLADLAKRLPTRLSGLENRLLELAYDSPEIRSELVAVDSVRSALDTSEPLLAAVLVERIREATKVIAGVAGVHPVEAGIACSYLAAEARLIEPQDKVVMQLKKLDDERERRERDLLERELDTKRVRMDKSRYDTFHAMLLHKNPIQLDVFQQYAPDWMQSEENKPLMQSIVALANACHYKWRYGDANLDVMTDMRGEAIFNATNETMQAMYEIPGVRETLEYFVQEFFDSATENGTFVLRLKGDSDVVDRLQNIGAELMGQVDWLANNRGLNGSDAMLAVATAFNLLYVGHIFEDADPTRKMKPCDAYVEQMRTFMYPAKKAESKQLGVPEQVGTEEGWGGQLGQWLTEVVVRGKRKEAMGIGVEDPDVKFMKDYQDGVVNPFPKRMFASFFVLTEVNVRDDVGGLLSDKMSLARALYEGYELDFVEGGRGSNPWGGFYDVADSAGRLYKIVKGDKKASPLPLGDPRAVQDVAGWAHDISDARKKIRGQKLLAPHINNREFLKWAIAACTTGGLYQHSAELVLMTPDVLTNQDVSFDGLLRRRDLVENDDDKIWIKREFHANGAGSRLDRSRIVKGISRTGLVGRMSSKTNQ